MPLGFARAWLSLRVTLGFFFESALALALAGFLAMSFFFGAIFAVALIPSFDAFVLGAALAFPRVFSVPPGQDPSSIHPGQVFHPANGFMRRLKKYV